MAKQVGRLSWREQSKRKRIAHGIYFEREKAIQRLGVSMKDFRTMCIYKGVFPRVPKVAFAGPEKIYYHAKDLSFIRKGSTLMTILKRRAQEKRIKKYIARRDLDIARHTAEDLPEVDFSVVLRQRYPTFDLALDDMDDALSCIALFTIMTVNNKHEISASVILECQKLLDHWHFYVSTLGCLTKAFASIKGYYYEANVCGKPILWLCPHEFTTDTSAKNEVDFAIFKAFLDLYIKHVTFVLYKLYTKAGYSYPPKQKKETSRADGRFLNYMMEPLEGQLPDHKAIASQDPSSIARRNLFAKQKVWVSRETPVWQMLFCLKACGVQSLGFDEALPSGLSDLSMSEMEITSNDITHHIVDRPVPAHEKLLARLGGTNRIFVQPQWVFDCLNCAAILPATPYAVGVVPPPHLSPWVDDEAEGHVPEQRHVLNEWSGGAVDARDDAITQESKLPEELENVEEVRAIVEHHQQKLKAIEPAEDLGKKLKDIKASAESKEEKQKRERGRISLPKKKRIQFNKLAAEEEAKRVEGAKLAAKAKLAKKKAKA